MAEPTFPYQYASNSLPKIADIDVENTQNSVLRPAMQAALIRLLDAYLNVNPATGTVLVFFYNDC